MEGVGVNTYRTVNVAGDTVLVEYHWQPRQGVASLTEEEPAKVQAQDLGSASRDLHEAIARGDYPQPDRYVQVIKDHVHPELDWDPLDDTKIWPENEFPLSLRSTTACPRHRTRIATIRRRSAAG